MTPKQMRAARALLDISQTEVANAIDVAVGTISSAEKGVRQMERTAELKSFYQGQGVEFSDFDGVRMKPSGTRLLKGREGFQELYDMLYDTAKTKAEDGSKQDIILYNGVSGLVMGALGEDAVKEQKERMSKIANNFRYRVIVEQGDATFFGADYCEYKWLSKEDFNDTTIFVFGSIVAYANFDGNIEVMLIDNQKVADSTRIMFSAVWNHKAINPNG